MDDHVRRDTVQENAYQMIKIYVPELNIHNCLHFSLDQLIWNVKQKCVASLPKELKDSFNYGLFRPPDNGKAANFLDEQLKLSDYTFDTIGYLELKYKRRIYKKMLLDEKQLETMHTRVNFRRLIKYVACGKVEKIAKMCSKGFDPNFHCPDSGETPLIIATGIEEPVKTLIALVTGGAFLDYRASDGSTALHHAVENKSLDAVSTLLQLGASPNCKDATELTPLHVSVTCVVDAGATKSELEELSATASQHSLLHELRQICKTRLIRVVDQLIMYGADANARNASGDTPLHMCALKGQTIFVEQLIACGCDRTAVNSANQTPYEVALTAGHSELAELIQNHGPEVVETIECKQFDDTLTDVGVGHELQPPPRSTKAPRGRVASHPKTITKHLPTATGGGGSNGSKQLRSSNAKEIVGQIMFGRDVSASSKTLPPSAKLILHTSKKYRLPRQ